MPQRSRLLSLCSRNRARQGHSQRLHRQERSHDRRKGRAALDMRRGARGHSEALARQIRNAREDDARHRIWHQTLRLLRERATRGSWSGSRPKVPSTISGGSASASRSGHRGRRESESSKRSTSGSRRRRFLRMRSSRGGSHQRVGASERSPDRCAPPIGHAARSGRMPIAVQPGSPQCSSGLTSSSNGYRSS